MQVLPTAIDNMSPTHPFIKAISQIPIAPNVHVNSIIPVKGDGPFEDGNDGVVQYKSAHIDGVESELVVRSSHSTQGNPHTIEEVRRILLEHAAAVGCSASPTLTHVEPAVPVSASARARRDARGARAVIRFGRGLLAALAALACLGVGLFAGAAIWFRAALPTVPRAAVGVGFVAALVGRRRSASYRRRGPRRARAVSRRGGGIPPLVRRG